MKKLGIFFIGILSILLVMFVGRSLLNQETRADESTGSGNKQTLTIFNWGEYIDPALIKQFEKES
ncbi:MAG: spermidine/putrescine ABC transporter substrate-binding protein, partial [Enterococcus lemanii]